MVTINFGNGKYKKSKFYGMEGFVLDDICKQCWNVGCRDNEQLRNDKLDVCKHMLKHPELWDFEEYVMREDDFE